MTAGPVVLANDLVLFHVSDADSVVHAIIMIEHITYCKSNQLNQGADIREIYKYHEME